jgi:Flp pilus assembly protein TadD
MNSPRARRVVLFFVLLALAFAAYSPALKAGFIWDDDDYVTENLTLRTADGLARIWAKPLASPQYYPLVFTSFWLEHQAWGLWPGGYHAVNIALHALSAFLLGLLLTRLGVPGAWLTALLFALHPLGVESVAWVTERKNVLSLVFALSSLLCLVRWFRLDSGPRDNDSGIPYVAGLVLFIMALLSKTVTSAVPAAALVLVWYKTGRVRLRDVTALAPFFLLGILSGVSTVWLERHHVGAMGGEWGIPFWARAVVAGRALWFYAGKTVWPAELIFNYPRWDPSAITFLDLGWPLAALGVLAVLFVLRTRLGRGPLAAALLFGGVLFPALGFFDVYPHRYSFVADHFAHHAFPALLALAAAGAVALARAAGADNNAGKRAVALGLAGAVLALPGAGTFRQCFQYKNLETLWAETARRNPGSWMAWQSLGNIRFQEGRLDEAERLYRKALDLGGLNTAQLWGNLGAVQVERGDIPGARALFKRSLQEDPFHADTLINLGLLDAREGDYAGAELRFRKVLDLEPVNTDALKNLAAALAGQGKPGEAAEYMERLAAIRPLAGAFRDLGILLVQAGRATEAVEAFRKAANLDPGDPGARLSLGVLLGNLGRTGEAEEALRGALKLAPDNADARGALGLVLSAQGRHAEALAELEAVVRLAPAPASRAALAKGFALAGDMEKARGLAEEVRKEAPALALGLDAFMEQAGKRSP